MYESILPNLLTAGSNLAYLYFTKSKTVPLYSYLPMIASTIYHLAETKHGLIGVYPLNKIAYPLLNVDRFFAFGAIGLVLNNIINDPAILTEQLVIEGICALLVLFWSEQDTIINNIFRFIEGRGLTYRIDTGQYLITHCLWHILAFKILATSF